MLLFPTASVNLFAEHGFLTTAIGTVGICGLTFFSGLKISRSIWSTIPGITLEKNNA